jgi:hypothetical protein
MTRRNWIHSLLAPLLPTININLPIATGNDKGYTMLDYKCRVNPDYDGVGIVYLPYIPKTVMKTVKL